MTNPPKKRGKPANPPSPLRERAEDMLRKSRAEVAGLRHEDVHMLIHELQVHQIELQMQNEELREAQCELAESRDRFSDLYEFAPVGYLTLDNEGLILEANLTAATLLGVERKDLQGMKFAIFVAPFSQDDYYRHRKAVFSGEVKQVCELKMRLARDSPLTLRLESIAFNKKQSSRRECRIVLIDVTEREAAQDGLKQSEERYRSLFNSLIEGFCIIELVFDSQGKPVDYRFLETNPAFEQQTGLHHAQGKLMRDLVSDHEARWFEIYGKIALTGEPMRFVNEAKALHRWYDVSAFRFGGAESRKVAILFNDITDSKRAEEAVRDREARLAAILRTASDAIITIDQRGIITAANFATEQMFGYSQAELNGRNIKLLMPSPYRDEHDSYIDRFLRTGEARILGAGREVVGLRKDGTTFPVDLAVSQVGHMGLFTGIIRDLSERKGLQRHVLEVAAEEQRRIGRELHDGTQQELIGLTLIAGTLRDVLTSLPGSKAKGRTIRQIDEPLFERLRAMSVSLSQNLSEASQHVRDLSHGIMPVQIDAQGLRSALERLAASNDGPNGMTCGFECPVSVTVADNTTATHLYRIAQEAVNNALRHSHADHIQISFQQENGQIILVISDNGAGMEFTGSEKDTADGMGLRTMAYRAGIIGGLLRIDHSANGGTLVRCTVPVARANDSPPSAHFP